MRTSQEAVPGVLTPGTAQLVEAGGQHFRGFRRGLDYAFIHTPRSADAERVIRPASAQVRILVPARGSKSRRRVYESLQGRPEVGPLPTPRRCHAALTQG